jgi:hypothetical protein
MLTKKHVRSQRLRSSHIWKEKKENLPNIVILKILAHNTPKYFFLKKYSPLPL